MHKRSEDRWIYVFTLIVMVITTVPYLVGYAYQSTAWRFSGLLFGVDDGNSYIAKMLTGANGDWLFRTPYTAYPQRGMLAFIPYILLGKLAGSGDIHHRLVLLYHLFRLAGCAVYIFATYQFLALFICQPRWRRLGTVLATVGGGLGWIGVLGASRLFYRGLPLEYYSPETFGFLMLFGLPHLAFARGLLLWGLRLYLQEPGAAWTWKTGVRAGLLLLALGLFQPLTVVIAWAVLAGHLLSTAAWQIWRRRKGYVPEWRTWSRYFIRAVWMGGISAPLAGYTFFAFILDPFLRTWQSQNIITSPPALDYLLAFAIVLPLVVIGVLVVLREQPWTGWLLAAWLILFPFLAYAPYNLQRRLPEGIWVMLVALTMLALDRGSPVIQRWAPRGLWLAYPSVIFIVLGSFFAATKPVRPIFLPDGEVRAYQFLAGRALPGAVVLSSFETGNPMPAWAPVRTLIGHGPESANFDVIKARVNCFYSACSDANRLDLLREFNVRYVFWGPQERAVGDWNPRAASFKLEAVYTQGDYTIFELPREPAE